MCQKVIFGGGGVVGAAWNGWLEEFMVELHIKRTITLFEHMRLSMSLGSDNFNQSERCVSGSLHVCPCWCRGSLDVEGLCFVFADGSGIFSTSHLRRGLLCTRKYTHFCTQKLMEWCVTNGPSFGGTFNCLVIVSMLSVSQSIKPH